MSKKNRSTFTNASFIAQDAFAYLTVDEEGYQCMAYLYYDGETVPMMGDWNRVQLLKNAAQELVDDMGRELKLVKYTAPALVEVIKPKIDPYRRQTIPAEFYYPSQPPNIEEKN